MVMINGITAILVAKPAKRNSEQNTSAKTAKPKERVALIPIIGGNFIGSPENSIINFGTPCVNINAAIITLAINNPMSIALEAGCTLNIFFITD